MHNYHFFFTSSDPLSNWYSSEFYLNNVCFCCMEQMLMYSKAKLFGDEEIANQLLLTSEPSEHKRLGRLVKNFNENIWLSKREIYVYIGALAKFSQNSWLRNHILSTGDKELVEASKYDKIWGCGLAATDPRILDKNNWLGLNLLGKTLMRVRDTLKGNTNETIS